jgi:hypothetical protein
MLRALLCWITGEPLRWRVEELATRRETPDVLQLLHQSEAGAFTEAQEVATRRQLAEFFSGDTRYAGLEALEELIEPSAV